MLLIRVVDGLAFRPGHSPGKEMSGCPRSPFFLPSRYSWRSQTQGHPPPETDWNGETGARDYAATASIHSLSSMRLTILASERCLDHDAIQESNFSLTCSNSSGSFAEIA